MTMKMKFIIIRDQTVHLKLFKPSFYLIGRNDINFVQAKINLSSLGSKKVGTKFVSCPRD